MNKQLRSEVRGRRWLVERAFRVCQFKGPDLEKFPSRFDRQDTFNLLHARWLVSLPWKETPTIPAKGRQGGRVWKHHMVKYKVK